MSECVVRDYTQADIPTMRGVWMRAFGDGEETITDFLTALPDIGGAVVAERGGVVVGAAYALTGMELLGAGCSKPPVCGYIYAVAVDENARHCGIGARLTLAAAELARRREADIICVEPATEGLFGWYEKLLGVKCVLRRSKTELESAPAELIMPLSSTEYMLWRERLLSDTPHIHHSNHSLEAQRKLLADCGGGFYAVESGIAAVSIEDDVAVIRELLCCDGARERDAAASVGAALGCERTVVYKSSAEGVPYIAADRELPGNCVWNLSFD